MLLGRELPTWKQILQRGRATGKKPVLKDEHTFFFAKSYMSIFAITKAIRSQRMFGANIMDESRVSTERIPTVRADGVALWLPDYFCYETVNLFEEDWLEIIYYPVDRELNPKWDEVRALAATKAMDVFLFTHYFGSYHEIGPARELCNRLGATLVEDCAHVLFDYEKSPIGKSGDFVIYSQHKQLPVSDGAVLRYQPQASSVDFGWLYEEIRKEYQHIAPMLDDKRWYQKKAVQRLTHMHRELNYTYEVHYGTHERMPHSLNRISSWSYNILSGYTRADYEQIGQIRRENVAEMNRIVTSLYPKVRPLNPIREYEVPYVAAYTLADCSDEEEKRATVMALIEKGFTILYWPDLPPELRYENGHDDAKSLSKDIFVIPSIHQDITPQILRRKLGKRR